MTSVEFVHILASPWGLAVVFITSFVIRKLFWFVVYCAFPVLLLVKLFRRKKT